MNNYFLNVNQTAWDSLSNIDKKNAIAHLNELDNSLGAVINTKLIISHFLIIYKTTYTDSRNVTITIYELSEVCIMITSKIQIILQILTNFIYYISGIYAGKMK